MPIVLTTKSSRLLGLPSVALVNFNLARLLILNPQAPVAVEVALEAFIKFPTLRVLD